MATLDLHLKKNVKHRLFQLYLFIPLYSFAFFITGSLILLENFPLFFFSFTNISYSGILLWY